MDAFIEEALGFPAASLTVSKICNQEAQLVQTFNGLVTRLRAAAEPPVLRLNLADQFVFFRACLLFLAKSLQIKCSFLGAFL